MSRRRAAFDELPLFCAIGAVGAKRDRDRVERERETLEVAAQSFASRLDKGLLEGPQAHKDFCLPIRWGLMEDGSFRGAEKTFRYFHAGVRPRDCLHVNSGFYAA